MDQQDLLVQVLKYNKCKGCSTAAGTEMHTCPFVEDVNNDNVFQCNCCKECVNQCSDDI